MAVGKPSINAFFFDINSNNKVYEVYIDVTNFPDTNDFLDCRYREKGSNGEWEWVLSPDLFDINSTQNTDKAFSDAIGKINVKLKEMFNLDVDTTIPESGVERIKWLLLNSLKWDGTGLVIS